MAASAESAYSSRASSLRRFITASLLIAAVALPILHLHLIDQVMPLRHNDLIVRWVGTRAALQGQNPYSPQVLRSMQTAYYGRPLTPSDGVDAQAFLYPATIVLPLAPFTRLPWPAAALVFLLLTIPLLILAFWLCARGLPYPVSRSTRTIAVVLALFSWPTVWGLRLLQPTLPLVAAILIAWFLLVRQQQILPGILLAIATIKPQLVLPLILWLFLWAVLQRSWRLIASFTATLMLLLGITQWLVPGWIGNWRASLHNYETVTLSSPPLEFIFGLWIGLALTAGIAMVAGFLLWRLRRASAQSPQFAITFALLLSLTLCVVPTHLAMVYNQILLLPGLLIVIYSQPVAYYAGLMRRVTIALFACSWASVVVGVVGESLLGPSDFWAGIPCRTMLLPPLLTITLSFQAVESLPWRPQSQVPAQIRPLEAVSAL